jgi:hypothetical protein
VLQGGSHVLGAERVIVMHKLIVRKISEIHGRLAEGDFILLLLLAKGFDSVHLGHGNLNGQRAIPLACVRFGFEEYGFALINAGPQNLTLPRLFPPSVGESHLHVAVWAIKIGYKLIQKRVISFWLIK